MNPSHRVTVVRGDLPADLAQVFEAARQVAWDVETSGLDWRHDRLGTCQLYTEDTETVIVSIGKGKPTRLTALLENAAVEKIFHHAPFDLRFMVHAWGARPLSVRCTKVASKLLAPEAPNETHSLQNLLRQHLGVAVQKGAIRTSDWTSSVLTKDQIDYAAGDVIYLLRLLHTLQARLISAGLGTLFDDCCAFLPARVDLELGGYPDVFAY